MIHSSAFVDLDGDCKNDLLIHSQTFNNETNITTSYLEIYYGLTSDNDMNRYCLLQGKDTDAHYTLDPTLGPFSVVDLNRDSFLDLVFPIIDTNKIFFLPNKKELGKDFYWSDSYCDKFSHKSNEWNNVVRMSGATLIRPNESDGAKIIKLSSDDKLVFYSDKGRYIQPTLRFGDLDADSHADLLVTLVDKSTHKRKSVIYLNDPKAKGETEELKADVYLSDKEYYTFSDENYTNAMFMDLDENGQLDILTTYEDTKGLLQYRAYYNNHLYDAFFLKSLTLHTKDVTQTCEIGTNYRFVATTLDGSRRLDSSFHLIQLHANHMNLPYAYIGIGRSNNYIENFLVITSSFTKGDKIQNNKMFTPIIPNSQLIIAKIENTKDNGEVEV
jgi:integrin alpha FG-GAP repeat containing protein 1